MTNALAYNEAEWLATAEISFIFRPLWPGLYYIILQLSHDDHQERCLYYKCVVAFVLALARAVNYAPRVMLHIVASLNDDPRGVIYDHKMFTVQGQML